MSPAPVLQVDTGPLVALLDVRDPAHALVTKAWLPLRGRHGRHQPFRLVIQDAHLR